MVIYGSRATKLAQETQVEKCGNCGTLNSVDLYIFQKYAHVFWIPFFPIGKTGVSECSHCKQALRLKEMPMGLKSSYDVLKQQSKTPVWTFAGIGLLTVLITLGIVSSQKNDAENSQFVKEPKAGDIYEIKSSVGSYTLYKVEAVEGDTVYVLTNLYETNKSTGLNDLKSKGNAGYGDEGEAFSVSQLQAMLKSGTIMDVER